MASRGPSGTAGSPLHVCVYGSSSNFTPKKYLDAAFDVGRLLAEGNHVCINGAGATGCMGALNRGCCSHGGRVIGVIHEKMVDGGAAEGVELQVAKGNTLEERKRMLQEPADCFIALPGGPGTFEELWEVASLELLGILGRSRPVCVLNTDGYYDGFVQQLTRAWDENLLRRRPAEWIKFVSTPAEAVAYVVAESGRRIEPMDFSAAGRAKLPSRL